MITELLEDRLNRLLLSYILSLKKSAFILNNLNLLISTTINLLNLRKSLEFQITFNLHRD